MFNFSEKRLARPLLSLAPSGNAGKVPPILEKITQDTLAELVETTRSRINFFMNTFRKLGFFHYDGGLVVYTRWRGCYGTSGLQSVRNFVPIRYNLLPIFAR